MSSSSGLTVAALNAQLGMDSTGFDQGMSGVLGKFGKLPPVGVAAGAAAAAGVAIAVKKTIELGASFDDAYDKIRVGTGATGAALDDLKDDFKAVLSEVPADMDTVSTAVADLNTRLGLTGEPLQELSRQFIDLSRLTGTDLPNNIHSMTRVFGDWNLAAEEQSDALDALFRAAQASGIGIEDLSSSVVQFGAPLRNLGFAFEDAVSMLALWDKAGVNTTTVMSGLRQGIGNLAKEGESIPETFRRVVKEIADLGDSAEGYELAKKFFGTRAAGDMRDAILGGKFAYEDLLEVVKGGEETIHQAARDTDDWRQSWEILKNKVLVKLEPIATALFKGLTKLFDAIIGIVENKSVAGFFGGLGSAFSWVGEVARKVWPVVKQHFIELWEIAGPLLRDLFETVKVVVGGIVDFIRRHWGTIGPIVKRAWEVVRTVTMGPLKQIVGIIRTFLAVIRGDWSGAWEQIQGIFRNHAHNLGVIMRALKDLLLGILRNLAKLAIKALTALPKALWRLMVAAGRGMLAGLKSGLSHIWRLVASIPGRIKDALGDVGNLLWDAGKAIIMGFWNGLKEAFGKVKDWFSGVGSWIKDHKGPLDVDRRLLRPAGRAIMDGLAGGLDDGMAGLAAQLRSVTAAIAVPVGPQIALPGVPGAAAPGRAQRAAGGGDGVAQRPVHVEVNWSTLTGRPSRREMEGLARELAVAMERIA